MLIPKPVVLVALVVAFFIGHLLVWIEQLQGRQKREDLKTVFARAS